MHTTVRYLFKQLNISIFSEKTINVMLVELEVGLKLRNFLGATAERYWRSYIIIKRLFHTVRLFEKNGDAPGPLGDLAKWLLGYFFYLFFFFYLCSHVKSPFLLSFSFSFLICTFFFILLLLFLFLCSYILYFLFCFCFLFFNMYFLSFFLFPLFLRWVPRFLFSFLLFFI